MINRLITVFTLLMMSCGVLSARHTATLAFDSAPNSVMPLIAPQVRLDMIDYYNAASSKASANNLDGKCRITALGPDHINVEVSDVSTWTLDLLRHKGDTIYMVNTTVMTPVPDSMVTFYDTDWNELSARIYTSPSLDDFVTAAKLTAEQQALLRSTVPFVLHEDVYDPVTGIMTVTAHLDGYLPADELEPVAAWLTDKITYRYDGKKFVRQK